MSTPITTAAALALFCDPQSIFEFKTKPVTIGGHVYATNRHWIVRVDPTAGQAHPTADPAWAFTTMAPELFAQAATRPWSDDAVAMVGIALPPPAICDGGADDKWTGVNVGQNYFSMVYLRALTAIPGCTLDPGQGGEVGRFKFPLAEGGEAMGLLMPRVRD